MDEGAPGLSRRDLAGTLAACAVPASETPPVTVPNPAFRAPAPNPAWAAYDTTVDELCELGPGLYAAQFDRYRTFILITGAGVIVADPGESCRAARLDATIKRLTAQPVKYVIYSHEGVDHAGGAEVFKAQGATIVAHAAAAAALRARTPATQGGEREVVPPDVTFAGETHRVSLGGRHVDLFHFGANFDCGMIFMRPDPGTYLFVADLITPGMAWQASDRNSVSALVPSLKRIESLRFDWLLPSHGPTVAHPSAVAERRRYIEAVIAAATDGRRAGLSDDEIVARTTLAEFAALKLAERAREPNLRHVLKSLR